MAYAAARTREEHLAWGIRVERDIGGPLYHRSTRHEPIRPTRRGTVLLKALQRPDIAELMRKGAKPPPLPRRPRPPRTSTRPPSRQEQSRAFYAAITARKITMTRPARAALRYSWTPTARNSTTSRSPRKPGSHWEPSTRC